MSDDLGKIRYEADQSARGAVLGLGAGGTVDQVDVTLALVGELEAVRLELRALGLVLERSTMPRSA